MLYLNEDHCKQMCLVWSQTIDVIRSALKSYETRDFSQPIKPYLRYGNPNNRIIAMPAYLGGHVDMAGIKWIASFPDNVEKGIPRANSVVILNQAQTGEPISFLNGAYLSIIRTASVSGLIINEYLKAQGNKKVNVGIIGFGPIGQYHVRMLNEHFQDSINAIFIYDKKGTLFDHKWDNTYVVNAWEEAYLESDIVITCTVANSRYIDKRPRYGSLLLNVSLRDYQHYAINLQEDLIVVDDWDEVARENTDIEHLVQQSGLSREKTINLCELIFQSRMSSLPKQATIMVNPMGLGIFDVALAKYFYETAIAKHIGILLP